MLLTQERFLAKLVPALGFGALEQGRDHVFGDEDLTSHEFQVNDSFLNSLSKKND